jgi:peptidyl-prolyl cis-trans isomerase C
MLRFRICLDVAPLGRRLLAAAVGPLLMAGLCTQASAQTPPAQTPPAATPPAPAGAATAPGAAADPVVAKVNDQPIHLSELQGAVQELPANARNLSPDTLYPMLLEQLIDGKALAIEARQAGLQNDAAVQRQIAAATDRVLQSAMLSQMITPTLTDDALRARYEKDIASKPGEDEVHARHILVDNEALAKQIIADLKKGGDFVALAKQYSKDPGTDHSGDLGFFHKDEMVPEFSAAAFAMQPGQISDTPVHTQFGWHVIQVLERRHSDPPPFDQARAELRQKMIQEGIQKALAEARTKVTVEKFNLDGTTPRATDTAQPPPTAKP